MNTVQEQWDGFRKLVVPKDAPEVQVTEMRRAFYAGVEAMLRIQWAIGDDAVSEDAGVAILEGVHDECRRFAEDVANGAA
ncbi:MAG: hypothetical protein K8F33_00100 [Thermomonas sp.]|uniref:hypothetical protein n=1 Tax=Thermomonas sp. TaxID=1971895 RepID=UPI001D5D6771|nr:hypothetical protein [Thermomonas sp.]MBZ0086495.1 hypothetical protein [Thermomonas sp.]